MRLARKKRSVTYKIQAMLAYTGPDFISEAAGCFEDDPLEREMTCISPGIARRSIGNCTPDVIIYCDGKGVECIRFFNDTRNDGVKALSIVISEREMDLPVAPGAGSERVTTGENIVEVIISDTAPGIRDEMKNHVHSKDSNVDCRVHVVNALGLPHKDARYMAWWEGLGRGLHSRVLQNGSVDTFYTSKKYKS